MCPVAPTITHQPTYGPLPDDPNVRAFAKAVREGRISINDARWCLELGIKWIEMENVGSLRNTRTAADILDEAAATFRDRNKVYGDNYLRVGNMMAAMFPNGITLKTPRDWNRMHMLLLTMVKQSRYATNWEKGGHADSALDGAVYMAMLKMIDEMGE